MKINKKMALIVISSVIIIAIPLSYISFNFLKQYLLDYEIEHVKQNLEASVIEPSKLLARSHPKLLNFKRLVDNKFNESYDETDLKTFENAVELNNDGVYRNKKASFDGKLESGMFLPPESVASNEQKIRQIKIKQVMDIYGASSTNSYENIWYLSLDRSEIIYDKSFPQFAFEQKADNDYTKTPWIQDVNPIKNPNNQMVVTKPLFDPVPKVWMISAIMPIFYKSEWIGSIGEDIQLNQVLSPILKTHALYNNLIFLLDSQGSYILAGDQQKELEKDYEHFKLDLKNSNNLDQIFKSELSNKPKDFKELINYNNTEYIVVGIILKPINYKVFRLVPIKEILAPLNTWYILLTTFIVLLSILMGLFIYFTTTINITNKITNLKKYLHNYADEKKLLISTDSDCDEVMEISHLVNSMIKGLEELEKTNKTAMDKISNIDKVWQQALDGTGDGLWHWNISTNEVFFSDTWKAMIGYKPDEIINEFTAWESLIHPEDKIKVQKTIQKYFDNPSEPYILEHRLKCKNGDYKWILARGLIKEYDEYGKPLIMIGTHTDISQQKQITEDSLKAKQLAEQLAKSKSNFLANMSHEIRTPMNGIMGLTALALNHTKEEQTKDYLGKALESAKSLMGILNDILDISKIDAGKMEIINNPFNIIELLNNINNLFFETAKHKNIEFIVNIDKTIPTHLIGDKLKLQQVLSNLISNALKFTSVGQVELNIQKISIKQDNQTQETALLKFEIIDTGIGMAPDKTDKLFKQFSQIDDSATRNFGGTGLGLSISQNILNLMGSECKVLSQKDKGTTFYFELELKVDSNYINPGKNAIEPNKQQNNTEQNNTNKLVNKNILIVEDNKINQRVIEEFLTLSKINTFIANDGIEAIQMVKNHNFDAVLMDVHMPNMSGIEATKIIRSQTQFKQLVIIAFTAGVTREETDVCFEVGMNDIISKPVEPKEVILKLCKWIN